MPKRRDADPAIRLTLIEADAIHVYIDEAPGRPARAIVRQVGGEVRSVDPLPQSGRFDILPEGVAPQASLSIGHRWDHAERTERPRPVAEAQQDKSSVGTHDKAMLAVEVSAPTKGGEPARRIVWLPFTKYMSMGLNTERTVALPDGRHVTMAFGRLQRPLPGFEVSLVDFQMIAYDHRGAPRDYQSVLRVSPTRLDFEPFEHITKLNSPLQAPFRWDERRSWPANLAGRLGAGMNPYQFKFSQAGWDAQGWQRTQQEADQGIIPGPYASFTILGVGNNPGIHMIAAGAVMMAVGIPWAFYVKPWLVRREKRRIQQQLAAGTYQKPRRTAPTAPIPSHEPVEQGV
jgi:hypothetical protein